MIKPQYLNILNGSFLLWLNNYILSRGECFSNVGTQFYPVNQSYNGLTAYSAPYSQMVSDFGVDGANVMTGVYVDGVFKTVGQSNFTGINYDKGQVYFNSSASRTVSGNYSIKDINVLYLNFSEQKLLFETKFIQKSKISQTLSGLKNDEVTYPCVYVRSEAGENKPFAFGGLDETVTNIGVYMFCDSQYQLDALKSILSDANKEYVPLFTTGEMPYNKLGGFKDNINFNYDTASAGKVSAGSGVLITDVQITSFKRAFYGDFSKLNPDVYWAIADFNLSKPRYPRSW